ncbi:putative NAD-dependent epimerase/dehydratase [Planotetraspora thailandica]|uniref:Putative NAD-dependent epimerase/dehydratase n=1 Tax=Planotetraspora thailandica TaxID=487172 RepID=A0A8J3XYT6_9ACTN|nr:putative NAD-dependent epimerase/dehydratase [Planotetraspora thailandica]
MTTAGAKVHRGALDDLDSLRSGAAAADGVVHLAFKHDFSDYAGAVAADLRAVEAIGAALEGSGKPFVNTSGTLMLAPVLGPGRLATEEDVIAPGSPPVPRIESENVAVALAGRGVRSSVVRLAPSVHSSADKHGFIPLLIGIARDKGLSAYVGDGATRWPAVHTLDAARLFRLALETAPAGSRLHGVADEGVPFRDIAEVIGRHLNVPAGAISREEADGQFGFLSALVSLDNPTSSRRTRELLGWRPQHPALIPDLEEGHYFR